MNEKGIEMRESFFDRAKAIGKLSEVEYTRARELANAEPAHHCACECNSGAKALASRQKLSAE